LLALRAGTRLGNPLGGPSEELCVTEPVHDVESDHAVTRVQRGPRRRWLIVPVIALGALVAGLVVAQGSDSRNPEAALRSAQAFVQDTSSFRFSVDLEARYASGVSGERAGSTATDRTGGSGAYDDGRWQATFEDSYSVDDVVVGRGTIYERSKEKGASATSPSGPRTSTPTRPSPTTTAMPMRSTPPPTPTSAA
jgi:hypothetical protein